MLASSRGRLSHIQSLEKRYDIRSAGAQYAPLRSLWGKRVLQYVLSVFCLPVRDPIPIFILIFYYIKVFSPKPFFQKRLENPAWKIPRKTESENKDAEPCRTAGAGTEPEPEKRTGCH